MSKTRIYRVVARDGLDGMDWLVRATRQAQALRYVTAKRLDIRVATQDDIVKLAVYGQYGVHDATMTSTEEGEE